jgi:uncharacterized membrane protein
MLQPKTIWIRIKSSLWFIPALMMASSAGLAVVMVALDLYFSMRFDERWPEVFGAGAEGSRTLLAAIATSMVALASVSFSITIVALSLAANQYTPRVLRNFMRDWGNQFVLGVFVSIFIYCLIVLRTIRGEER